jgi:hypothetical protein
MPVLRKTGFKSTEMIRKAMNPVSRYFQSSFDIDNFVFTRKIMISTKTNKIPFSFVKNANEDTMNPKTI